MTENPFTLFDRAASVLETVIAAVKPDQLDAPSPCEGWTVRELINHLVQGNLYFVSVLTGGPRPQRDRDYVGDDAHPAFASSVRELRDAFAGEGVLEGTFPTPFGQGRGSSIISMRVVEMSVHAWDIASSTGQSTDLDHVISEWSLRALSYGLSGDRTGSPFGAEQPAPADATPAERLAAFSGRTVVR
jgi:uncharacterized protein (TIGR03086 family)